MMKLTAYVIYDAILKFSAIEIGFRVLQLRWEKRQHDIILM